MTLFSLLRQLHSDFVNYVSRYFVTREVIRVLRSAHIQELSATPGEQWPLVRSQHVEQIQAVRDGKLDIVDRRSWSFPYVPESLHRLNQPLLKAIPYNIRRFSETPVPRKAINIIKNAVTSLDWNVTTIPEVDEDSETEKRVRVATACLRRPNNVDSFRTFLEAVVEDIIVNGEGCIEPRLTPWFKRPVKMWPVDSTTIRIYADWTESTPDRPRFAQMTGLKGERGIVAFLNSELIYIKDNPRSNTPFGLGKLQTAFTTVMAFLGAQDMASKAGADQVHKTWLWWQQPVVPAHMQTVRRHIQNDLEGQAKISLMAGLKKPDIIDVQAVNPEDLLLDWQEFLIRIIASAFDLSPMALGIERDVARNTGEVMALADFRQAIVPMARRIEDSFTRDLIHGFLGWRDLQFEFQGLDDPNKLNRVSIQQRQFMMSAITPDEIREDEGKPPLPGGWGKLTQFQQQLIIMDVRATQGQVSGGTGGVPGAGGFPGAGGGGMGGGMPGAGGGATQPKIPGAGGANLGMAFSTEDVAKMSPEDIGVYQQTGLLPGTNELGKQMEEDQPGILETLSEDLQEFFKAAEKLDKKGDIKPAKVTAKDEKEQQKKYAKADRSPTLVEQMYQDRGLANQPRVNKIQPKDRGRYPRNDRGK